MDDSLDQSVNVDAATSKSSLSALFSDVLENDNTVSSVSDEDIQKSDPKVIPIECGEVVKDRVSKKSNWLSKNSGGYGAIHAMMSGSRIDNGIRSNRVTRAAQNKAALVRKYMTTTSDLFEPHLAHRYDLNADVPHFDGVQLLWPPETLSTLTTLDFQRAVCAALNSKVRLSWLIGVRDGKIEGCKLDRSNCDVVSNAFTLALTEEFQPDLDLNLVDLKFHPINNATDKVLIEVVVLDTIRAPVALATGKKFYFNSRNEIVEERCREIFAQHNHSLEESPKSSSKHLDYEMLAVGGLAVIACGLAICTITRKLT